MIGLATGAAPLRSAAPSPVRESDVCPSSHVWPRTPMPAPAYSNVSASIESICGIAIDLR